MKKIGTLLCVFALAGCGETVKLQNEIRSLKMEIEDEKKQGVLRVERDELKAKLRDLQVSPEVAPITSND